MQGGSTALAEFLNAVAEISPFGDRLQWPECTRVAVRKATSLSGAGSQQTQQSTKPMSKLFQFTINYNLVNQFLHVDVKLTGVHSKNCTCVLPSQECTSQASTPSFHKKVTPRTSSIFPGSKANPATIVPIRKIKISRNVVQFWCEATMPTIGTCCSGGGQASNNYSRKITMYTCKPTKNSVVSNVTISHNF